MTTEILSLYLLISFKCPQYYETYIDDHLRLYQKFMTNVTLHAGPSGGGADRGGHHGGLQVPPPGHHAVHLRRLGDRHQRGPVPQAVP